MRWRAALVVAFGVTACSGDDAQDQAPGIADDAGDSAAPDASGDAPKDAAAGGAAGVSGSDAVGGAPADAASDTGAGAGGDAAPDAASDAPNDGIADAADDAADGSAGSLDWVWPLTGTGTPDPVNSPFGPRLRASAGFSYEFHPGIDIAAAVGTDAHAVRDGSVRLLTDDAGCKIDAANDSAADGCTPVYPNGGRIVQLDHGAGVYSNYLHLSAQAAGLATGSAVVRAAVVGQTGTTGTTTFPHLHFEIRDGSYFSADVKNPLGYLPWSGNAATVVTGVTATSDGGSGVAVSVEAPPHDLDLNRVGLQLRDPGGAPLFDGTVAFDEKENCGSNVATTNGVTLLPEAFNVSSAAYRLTVVFTTAVPSGTAFDVTVTDVSSLASTSSGVLP